MSPSWRVFGLLNRPGGLAADPGFVRIGRWPALFGLLLAVKLGFLALDHQPQFMMGDSATYLVTAMEKVIPPDRSFSYRLFVRRVALKSRSLLHLILAQTLAGMLGCLALAYLLSRHFDARAPLFAAAAALSAAEPIQLVFERQMMTECLALPASAFSLVAALSYLDRPRPAVLLGFHVAGIALVSLRLSALPYVAGSALMLPAMAWLGDRGKFGRDAVETPRALRRRLPLHLALSGLCFLALHGAYRQWYGVLTGGPAAYIHEDGYFKLAAWAPILAPADAIDDRSAEALKTLAEPGQRQLELRKHHRWHPEGLVERLKRLYPSRRESNRAANRIGKRAALRAPGELAVLTGETYLGYWKLDVEDDPVLLRDPLPSEFLWWMRERFDQDASSWGPRWSATKRYFRSATPWFRLILLAPLLGLAAIPLVRRQRRAAALFVAWTAASLLLPYCLVNTGWSFRHLHQLGWLTLLSLFMGAAGLRFPARDSKLPQTS